MNIIKNSQMSMEKLADLVQYQMQHQGTFLADKGFVISGNTFVMPAGGAGLSIQTLMYTLGITGWRAWLFNKIDKLIFGGKLNVRFMVYNKSRVLCVLTSDLLFNDNRVITMEHI